MNEFQGSFSSRRESELRGIRSQESASSQQSVWLRS